MESIYNLNLDDLENYLLNINQKKYRAKQLFEWLYQKRITSIDQITNIKKGILQQIINDYSFAWLKIKEKQSSQDGTVKYLFELADGNLVETVLMPQDYGNSVCVSSQVGCNMSCQFCASGKLKLKRNLTTAEMVLQVLMVQKELDESDQRVSHVVVMGIGEPFDNYDNLMKFIRIINNPFGLAIGARHITVSTCGLISGIKKFQDEDLQINLALSLHSAINEKRSKIMPVNIRNDLDKLKVSLKEYYDKTNRRLTFEYIMLKGFNDGEEDAQALIKYAKGLNVYINLIPYNPISESEFEKISRNECFRFYDILKQAGLNVTIRKEFGQDIDAACGQLRSKRKESV